MNFDHLNLSIRLQLIFIWSHKNIREISQVLAWICYMVDFNFHKPVLHWPCIQNVAYELPLLQPLLGAESGKWHEFFGKQQSLEETNNFMASTPSESLGLDISLPWAINKAISFFCSKATRCLCWSCILMPGKSLLAKKLSTNSDFSKLRHWDIRNCRCWFAKQNKNKVLG